MSSRIDIDSNIQPSIGALTASESLQSLRRIKSAIAKALMTYVTYRAHRAARARLAALDDRMLKDIGLDRSEIDSALLNRGCERKNGARMPEIPNY